MCALLDMPFPCGKVLGNTQQPVTPQYATTTYTTIRNNHLHHNTQQPLTPQYATTTYTTIRNNHLHHNTPQPFTPLHIGCDATKTRTHDLVIPRPTLLIEMPLIIYMRIHAHMCTYRLICMVLPVHIISGYQRIRLKQTQCFPCIKI